MNLLDSKPLAPGRLGPGITKHECYAHFPGTGPIGETCKTCKRFLGDNTGMGLCGKWRELMRMPRRNKNQEIEARSPACKYWQRK